MDPVKKYQFKYNESLCMIDKYPEISRNPDASVSVAPGEGQIPKNIMDDEDWDVKAFPHLHNADGSNGKDHDRRVRLTDQNYFIQRICNKEQRFAKSPAYMYAALAFIEKKQINRNISLAGTRGKQVKSKDGRTSYELKDAYRVLENVRNTPRYWKQAKYEMLAKLDNLGPFQIFFTLSCADMRWDENFAAILLDRGFEIKYRLVNDEEGNWDTEVEGRKMDGVWKNLKQFIDEDVIISLHELVTRYFQHRVKNFIDKVMMGKNNPMHVRYYTYKVEFQDRGAGHIHGTLWLRLNELEKLPRDKDGKLRTRTKEEKLKLKKDEVQYEGDDNSDNTNLQTPLAGIKAAFTKIRKNETLSQKDIEVLRIFIDEFTTVSIQANTVEKVVQKLHKK